MIKKPCQIVLLMGLFCSCSTLSGPKPKGIKEELKKHDIGLESLLDLARSSYLKGCVDGKNTFVKIYPENKRSSFAKCTDMAKSHQEDIREILE